MPNRDVHVPVSVSAGGLVAGVCAIDQPIEVLLSRTAGGAIGGWLGGLMPDIIDPSKNGPNHRSLGHGIIPVSLICSIGFEKFLSLRDHLKDKSDRARFDDDLSTSLLLEALIGAMDGFIAGYLAHLALDARTPKGLPIIG